MVRSILWAGLALATVSVVALEARAMGDGTELRMESWAQSARGQLATAPSSDPRHARVRTSGLTGRTHTVYQAYEYRAAEPVAVCDGVGSDCTGGTSTFKIKTSGITGRSGVTYTPYTQYRPRGPQGDRPLDTPAAAGLPDGRMR